MGRLFSGARYPPASSLPFLPRTRCDKVIGFVVRWGGVLYCCFLMCTLLWLARYVSCPAVYSADHCEDMDTTVVVVLFQLLANLFFFNYFSRENKVEHWQRHYAVASLCRNVNEDEETNGEAVEGETQPASRGKYCVECNRPAPIRSHHCPLCDQCVLRKDHHCYITGACVGLGNQRYFIVFLFWAFIGTALSSKYIFWYMDQEIEPWYPYGIPNYIAPVALVRWCLGYVPLFSVVVCIIFSFSCASTGASFAFFVTQIFYTLHGYTMFEYHSCAIREAYDGDGDSVMQRLRLLFGPFPLLNFLFPCVWWKQRLTPEIADNLFRVRSKLL